MIFVRSTTTTTNNNNNGTVYVRACIQACMQAYVDPRGLCKLSKMGPNPDR